MSTRACIAQTNDPKANSWQGVYSHMDGYPSGLGRDIWFILQRSYFRKNENEPQQMTTEDYQNAVQVFCKTYITDHPGGWSSLDSGVCYCHDPYFVKRDGVRISWISEDDPDPLFIEWVYILNPETVSLTILASLCQPVEGKPTRRLPLHLGNGVWDYGHCVCRHVNMGWIDLLGEEPDWKKMEDEAEKLREQERLVVTGTV